MDKGRKPTRNPNPRKGANIFSIITFAYTIPTFIKGFRRDLQEEDITEHLKVHASKTLGDRLEEAWKKELHHNQNPSLWRAVRKICWVEFVILGFSLLLLELIKISQPIALSHLITYYTEKENETSRSKAYICAGIIVGASLLNVVGGHVYMMNLQHFGMKLRVALCSVVYRKSLRLSKSVLGGTTIGQMVNLLSNDVNRCDPPMHHTHYLVVAPLETIIIICLLYNTLGLTSTIGLFLLVVLVPFQMYLGKKTSVFRLKTALKTDERVRLMNEIISAIQVIKMYTWEKPFAKLVAIARTLEIRYVRATCYIRALLSSLAIFTTSFAVFLTILAYVLLDNTPNAEYVFVVTSFYNILKFSMTKQFPRGITEVAEMRVSISRIQKFLLYDETQANENIKQLHLNINQIRKEAQTEKIEKLDLNINQIRNMNGIDNNAFQIEKNTISSSNNVGVAMQNVSAKWISSSSENTLDQINFEAQQGELVAIIGPVGSGKTTLLNIILNELHLESGTLKVEGKISYASQEPWVFAGTVQQNILFGQLMIPERYEEVLRVCALERDLLLLPYGDETLVGERGVTLSGGQRARVSLARAIYKEADIYLLDDPLSAVDAHVGKQLFEDCISNFLQNKCTILVTHQLQYLQNVNRIFLIENGKITTNATYQELRKSGIDFAKHLNESKDEEVADNVEDKSRDPNITAIRKNGTQAEIKEQRSTGNISSDVYMSYFKAGGSLFTALFVLFLFVLAQASVNFADYFLTHWVNMEQAKLDHNDDATDYSFVNLSRDTCLYIYSAIIATILIITLVRSFSFFEYCMKASTKLHNNMFSNIVHAPMLFFNTNASGRILNRFSKDMGSIDDILPVTAIDFIQCALAIAGVAIMVSLVNPWLFIVTLNITAIFLFLRIVYMRTSRSMKRLEGITRSPVFTHINASLQGLTTIRAFEAQNVLRKEFDDHQDLHSSVWYLFISCSRAFGFWLDVICVGYIAMVTFSFFLMDDEEYGGNVGLAITQAISLTGTFQLGMRQWTELENQMTSVERVVEYTKLEHEVNPTEKIPPPNWPQNGSLTFISTSLRYSSTDPYVLKKLTFSIKSNEKIGIVGRTGAGKSSLIYALFQLAKTEGAILIDNIDITQIPLHTLRSKVSIIPQEPVLFSGTLRKNLDPFNEYSDIDLWNGLEEVELKKLVADLPAGLNTMVSEGGSNFSVGQRQLVCLARAVIRKNKILIVDEATANVDPQTDILIQKAIRRKFADCTVLTIAHRLNTIIDFDKILVMDAGNAVEFNHPHLLLQNEDGLFYGLIQQTGFAMAESLTNIASKNYKESFLRN